MSKDKPDRIVLGSDRIAEPRDRDVYVCLAFHKGQPAVKSTGGQCDECGCGIWICNDMYEVATTKCRPVCEACAIAITRALGQEPEVYVTPQQADELCRELGIDRHQLDKTIREYNKSLIGEIFNEGERKETEETNG